MAALGKKKGQTMGHGDNYLLPVPKKNIAAYRKMPRNVGKIWREHGALEYRECFGDDLRVKGPVPFPEDIKAKPAKTVFFSWVAFKSRAHRDRVNTRALKDPRLTRMHPKSMPLDAQRMHYGGPEILVNG